VAIAQLGHQDESSINRYIDPRFTANHDAARLLPRPDCPVPPQVEVEVTTKPPAPLPTEPVRLKLSIAAATGNDSLIATLAAKDRWTSQDLHELIAELKVYHADVSRAAGVSEQWFSGVLAGTKPLSQRVERLIRRALGMVPNRAYRAERAAQDSRRAARKGGAA
jgi:hypothetical protein